MRSWQTNGSGDEQPWSAQWLALANGVSTVLECGAGLCPDNPVVYELLQGLKGP